MSKHDWTLLIVHLLLSGMSVLVVAKLLPGIKVRSYFSAVLFAAAIGVLNAIAWTYLAALTIPLTWMTLGISGLVINGVIFMVAGALVPGVEVSGCLTAMLASLGVTFMNWAMHFVLGKWAP